MPRAATAERRTFRNDDLLLYHRRQLDVSSRHVLDLARPFGNLIALLLIGRGHHQGQQVAQSIYGQMNLGAVLLLMAIIAGPFSAFYPRLQGLPVKDSRRGLPFFAKCLTQQGAQVVNDVFKATGLHPSLHLLVDEGPRRKTLGQIPPSDARPHDVTQRVEDFA